MKKKKFRKGFGYLNNLPKVCPVCGSTFLVPNHIVRKFCSEQCRKLSKPGKEDIFRRDNYKCVYCGKSSIEDGVKLAVDHIYPVIEGGGADLFNLVASCEYCNAKKHSKLLSKETILRLWERNEGLNNTLPSYDELKAYFLANLKQRKSKAQCNE